MGSSPRGALALMLTARAYAVISGRDYVMPEDVKAVAPSVLAHRVTVKPELWMSDVSGASVVRSVLAQVATPGARERIGVRAAGGPVTATVTAGWRPTPALVRAALVSAAFAAVAVVAGRPDLLVLAVPFLVHAVAVVVRRPSSSPRISSRLEHTSLREGEGTTAVTTARRGARRGARRRRPDPPALHGDEATGRRGRRGRDRAAGLGRDRGAAGVAAVGPAIGRGRRGGRDGAVGRPRSGGRTRSSRRR